MEIAYIVHLSSSYLHHFSSVFIVFSSLSDDETAEGLPRGVSFHFSEDVGGEEQQRHGVLRRGGGGHGGRGRAQRRLRGWQQGEGST